MTREEYQKCKLAASMYHDKVRECETLKRRLAQIEQENKILKEQLGYRRIRDAQYSRDDTEVFMLVKMNCNRR